MVTNCSNRDAAAAAPANATDEIGRITDEIVALVVERESLPLQARGRVRVQIASAACRLRRAAQHE